MSPYGMKGMDFTKEEIMSECVKTVDKAIHGKAKVVLGIIIFTIIIGKLGLWYFNKHPIASEYQDSMVKDILENLFIIDYAVMVAYLMYVILLPYAW